MKFRLVDLETWPDSEAQEIALASYDWIEANNPGHAAKRFAELGGRGGAVIEDEQGVRTAWQLHSVTIHYAYPVLEKIDG